VQIYAASAIFSRRRGKLGVLSSLLLSDDANGLRIGIRGASNLHVLANGLRIGIRGASREEEEGIRGGSRSDEDALRLGDDTFRAGEVGARSSYRAWLDHRAESSNTPALEEALTLGIMIKVGIPDMVKFEF